MNLTQDKGLIQNITRAINGEYSAIACYEKLINMASTEKEKERIKEIRNDEIRHFHEFSAIYTLIMNQQPRPQITEQCPNDYANGLRFAFEDEQNTVDFYYEIADEAISPFIKQKFQRAAADEQHHAVWFLSMMK